MPSDGAFVPYDVAIAEEGGRLVAHRLDCADVRRQADAGVPVMSMFACYAPLPDDVEHHSCFATTSAGASDG